MEKIIIIIITLLSCVKIYGEKTPEAVKTLISCTEQLSYLSTDNVDRANRLQQNIEYCLYCNGISTMISNSDLYYIGALSDKRIEGRRYSIQLKRLIFDQHCLSIKHEIEFTEIIKKPDQGKDVPHMYKTTVHKRINYNNQQHDIWQQFGVPFGNESQITKIATKTEPFNKKIVTEENPLDKMTADELLDLAAEYYTKKNHKSAYDTYAFVTKKYDDNAEGWYRLAIMTYFNKGCKNRDSKELAKEYMQKALARSKGELHDKADNVLYFWEHSSFNSF